MTNYLTLERMEMSYNTDKPKLKIPEYGRTLQQMVDHCLSIEDKDKRNLAAESIIKVMGEINPHLRNVPDFQHKLWDQLFIMSEFKLDIDSPFPIPVPETFTVAPDQLLYPKVLNKYRYYGHYIRSLVDVALSWEEGEKRDALIIAIAKHMKKSYIAWNKENVEDDIITEHLLDLSNGKINLNIQKELLPNGTLGTPNPQGIPVIKKRFVPGASNTQRVRSNAQKLQNNKTQRNKR